MALRKDKRMKKTLNNGVGCRCCAENKEEAAVRPPKPVLRIPDLAHSKSAVLNSLGSESSHRTYHYAIDKFINWYCSEPRLAFNRTVVLLLPNHILTN